MFKTFPFQHQIAICYMYTYIYAIDVIYIYAIDVISPITISFLEQSCHIKHISGGSGSRRAGHEVASLKLFCWPNLSWTLTILQTSTISKKISGAMHWPCINEIQIWNTIKYSLCMEIRRVGSILGGQIDSSGGCTVGALLIVTVPPVLFRVSRLKVPNLEIHQVPGDGILDNGDEND